MNVCLGDPIDFPLIVDSLLTVGAVFHKCDGGFRVFVNYSVV